MGNQRKNILRLIKYFCFSLVSVIGFMTIISSGGGGGGGNGDENPPIINDTDSDGINDETDMCPGTQSNEAVDTYGCSASQREEDIFLYISPDGDDQWSGMMAEPNQDRTDGPLSSLDGARRAARLNKKYNRPITVRIADGTYILTEPVQYTSSDSGTEQCPITYEASIGAKPIFSAGRVISNFVQGENNIWEAYIPEVESGEINFEQLYVNGRRATRARSPNKYYYYMKSYESVDNGSGLSNNAFIGFQQDIQPLFNIPQEKLHEIVMVNYHRWSTSFHQIVDVEQDINTVILNSEITYFPFDYLQIEPDPIQRYHIENFKEALDEPGEWYLDSDGMLFYKPLSGENISDSIVIAPINNEFIILQGLPTNGNQVKYISFKGLIFNHAGYLLPEKGLQITQAATTWDGDEIKAAIMGDYISNINFIECEIAHIGMHAIWFRWGCSDSKIEKCYFHDLGAGGIKIGDTAIAVAPTAEKITKYINIDNNIIRDGGHIFNSATGILIGHSSDNTVSHNEVSDFFYTGISVGLIFQYEYNPAKRNIIEYNHIHHLGWGVLSDMGGVYTLGESEGTVINNNYIHHLFSYEKIFPGSFGIYLDQASSYIEVKNNLIHSITSSGIYQNWGKDNIIQNNIFAYISNGQLYINPNENFSSYTFSNNIVYWNNDKLFNGIWDDNVVTNSSNLYFDASGNPVTFFGMQLEEWQKAGRDEGSIVADPMFVNPEEFDFHLLPNSPANQVGFNEFDYEEAGVYGTTEWVNLANSIIYPPVEFAPNPVHSYVEGFEESPIDAGPSLAKTINGNEGDSIEITNETAANGSHSLGVSTVQGPNYGSYIYYTPYCEDGVVNINFNLLFKDGTQLMHEWRDWRYPAQSVGLPGPSFFIASNILHANGQDLMSLPSNEWINFNISSKVGNNSNQGWNLSVTLPNQEKREFSGLENNAEFDTLNFIGFFGGSYSDSTFYLDDIEISYQEN